MPQRVVPGTDQRTTVPWTASRFATGSSGGAAARTGATARNKATSAKPGNIA